MASHIVSSWLLLFLAAVAQATLQVIPGGTWTASNGRHVQAHGAGITKVGSTYYMIGEDKTDGSAFQNVNCYATEDLVNFRYVGALLTRQSSGDLGPSRVVERPKVIYNDRTGQYVMWLHIDSSNYGEAKVGVATSSSVCGQYTYRGSFRPLNHESRDIGLFKDDDGAAYLLSEDRPNGLRIMRLSDDYLSVASEVFLFTRNIESPTIYKKDGVYFLAGSQLTGWNSNDNLYVWSRSLSSGWSSWTTFADTGSNTYDSQTSYILPFGSGAIYMGDRWRSTNLARSTYIWLPLEFSGTTMRLQNRVNWVPNSQAGTWASAPSETAYEGESASLTNGARSVSCSGCSGSAAAGYVGGDSSGTVTFSNVSAQVAGRTTVRVKHQNGNTSERYATVTVNGVSQQLSFLPSEDGNSPASSSLHVTLNAGSSNTIVITRASSGGWGPDIDRIFVPVS